MWLPRLEGESGPDYTARFYAHLAAVVPGSWSTYDVLHPINETSETDIHLLAEGYGSQCYLHHCGFERFFISVMLVVQQIASYDTLFNDPLSAIAHWELTHG